jgi:type III secretion system YscI/HrpB-like protein
MDAGFSMTWNNARSGVSGVKGIDNFLSGMSPTGDVSQIYGGGYGYPAAPSVDPTRGVHGTHGVHAAAPTHFGDSVMNGAQDLRAAFRDTITRVKGIMAGGMEGMGVAQFMEIQAALMQLNMMADFFAKVSDKGSQALQTLFRNQG